MCSPSCRGGLVRGWPKAGKGPVKSVSMVPLSCLYPFSMLDVVHGDVPVRIEFPSQDVFVDPAGARKLYLRTRRTDFTGSFRFEGNSDMQCRIHAVGLSASRMMMSCSWGRLFATLRATCQQDGRRRKRKPSGSPLIRTRPCLRPRRKLLRQDILHAQSLSISGNLLQRFSA